MTRLPDLVKIRIVAGSAVLTATLDDTEVARDFASLLPLALTLTDYAETEKVSDLPRQLSITFAPKGASAAAGDVMHYAPWGNLALFYRSAPHAHGLVRLGRFDDRDVAVAVLRRPGPVTATIERI